MWQVMSQVSYQKIKDESLGFELDYPLFVFSAFPYKSCFFCGGAGPETVIEVFSTNGINFTSEKIEIKGILKLNRTDLNRLMFQLLNAEEIK